MEGPIESRMMRKKMNKMKEVSDTMDDNPWQWLYYLMKFYVLENIVSPDFKSFIFLWSESDFFRVFFYL